MRALLCSLHNAGLDCDMVSFMRFVHHETLCHIAHVDLICVLATGRMDAVLVPTVIDHDVHIILGCHEPEKLGERCGSS